MSGTVPVTPGQPLTVIVGQDGPGRVPAAFGYGNGGVGEPDFGGLGGGGTGIITRVGTLLLVAGGGGGGGIENLCNGGETAGGDGGRCRPERRSRPRLRHLARWAGWDRWGSVDDQRRRLDPRRLCSARDYTPLPGGGGGGGGYLGGSGGAGPFLAAGGARGGGGGGGGGTSYAEPSATQVNLSGLSDRRNGDNGQVTITFTAPDTVGPVAAPHLSPLPNAAGWNNSDVTVQWRWSDLLGSGLDADSCTQQSTASGEGTQTVSGSCADHWGNQSTSSTQVKIDATKPVDRPVVDSGPDGATVEWNWTDALPAWMTRIVSRRHRRPLSRPRR